MNYDIYVNKTREIKTYLNIALMCRIKVKNHKIELQRIVDWIIVDKRRIYSRNICRKLHVETYYS